MKKHLKILLNEFDKIRNIEHDFSIFEKMDEIVEIFKNNDYDKGKNYSEYENINFNIDYNDENNATIEINVDYNNLIYFEISFDVSNCGLMTMYNLEVSNNFKNFDFINKLLDIVQKKITVNTMIYTCLIRDKNKFKNLKKLKFNISSKHVNAYRTRNQYYLMHRDVIKIKK